jgi:ApaG protein
MITGTFTADEVVERIKIRATSRYLEDQSQPQDNQYVWAYRVQIENRSDRTVQMRTRHWFVTNALGMVHEVHGAGVVGHLPVIGPGGRFDYESGTPLRTASGIMHGAFRFFVFGPGMVIKVPVPGFSLDSDEIPARVN